MNMENFTFSQYNDSNLNYKTNHNLLTSQLQIVVENSLRDGQNDRRRLFDQQ